MRISIALLVDDEGKLYALGVSGDPVKIGDASKSDIGGIRQRLRGIQAAGGVLNEVQFVDGFAFNRGKRYSLAGVSNRVAALNSQIRQLEVCVEAAEKELARFGDDVVAGETAAAEVDRLQAYLDKSKGDLDVELGVAKALAEVEPVEPAGVTVEDVKAQLTVLGVEFAEDAAELDLDGLLMGALSEAEALLVAVGVEFGPDATVADIFATLEDEGFEASLIQRLAVYELAPEGSVLELAAVLAEADEFNRLTVPDLKKLLGDAGIEFASGDKKADLVRFLVLADDAGGDEAGGDGGEPPPPE